MTAFVAAECADCGVKLSYNKLSADVNYSGETKYVPGPGYDFLAVGGDTVVDFFFQQFCATC